MVNCMIKKMSPIKVRVKRKKTSSLKNALFRLSPAVFAKNLKLKNGFIIIFWHFLQARTRRVIDGLGQTLDKRELKAGYNYLDEQTIHRAEL